MNIIPFRRVTVGGDVLSSKPAAFEHSILGKYILKVLSKSEACSF